MLPSEKFTADFSSSIHVWSVIRMAYYVNSVVQGVTVYKANIIANFTTLTSQAILETKRVSYTQISFEFTFKGCTSLWAVL